MFCKFCGIRQERNNYAPCENCGNLPQQLENFGDGEFLPNSTGFDGEGNIGQLTREDVDELIERRLAIQPRPPKINSMIGKWIGIILVWMFVLTVATVFLLIMTLLGGGRQTGDVSGYRTEAEHNRDLYNENDYSDNDAWHDEYDIENIEPETMDGDETPTTGPSPLWQEIDLNEIEEGVFENRQEVMEAFHMGLQYGDIEMMLSAFAIDSYLENAVGPIDRNERIEEILRMIEVYLENEDELPVRGGELHGEAHDDLLRNLGSASVAEYEELYSRVRGETVSRYANLGITIERAAFFYYVGDTRIYILANVGSFEDGRFLIIRLGGIYAEVLNIDSDDYGRVVYYPTSPSDYSEGADLIPVE